MHWAGGCPSRVHRGSKVYPGQRRFMEPVPVVLQDKPRRNWKGMVLNVFAALGAFYGLIMICIVLMLTFS